MALSGAAMSAAGSPVHILATAGILKARPPSSSATKEVHMNPLRLGLIAAAVATAIIACLSYARAEAVNFCTTPEFAWNASVSDDEFVILKKDHKCITAPVEAYPNRVVDRGYIDDKPIYIVELSVFYKDAWWGLYTALDNDPWYQPLTKARYDEEWENRPANVRRWFNNLMQPDNANVSCCGDAKRRQLGSHHHRPRPAHPEQTLHQRGNTGARPQSQNEVGRRQSDRPRHHLHRR
jgi:hypothetical protein